MDFYVPLGAEPSFPDNYCKVAAVNEMFDNIFRLTEKADGSWVSLASVVQKYVCSAALLSASFRRLVTPAAGI